MLLANPPTIRTSISATICNDNNKNHNHNHKNGNNRNDNNNNRNSNRNNNKTSESMPPQSKQSLLSIDAFVKNPKKSTLKAHEKMERANGLRKSSPVASKKKAKVDQKKEKRIKEENAIRDGGAAWQHYMDMKGFDDVKRHNPFLLFQVYGPPPEPDSISSSDEE